MSCMYFHHPPWDPDDSTESSDSITYWRKLLVPTGPHRVDLEHRLHKRMMSMGARDFDAELIDAGRLMIHRVRRYDVFMASRLPTP
jgi:hypothetical protein